MKKSGRIRVRITALATAKYKQSHASYCRVLQVYGLAYSNILHTTASNHLDDQMKQYLNMHRKCYKANYCTHLTAKRICQFGRGKTRNEESSM